MTQNDSRFSRNTASRVTFAEITEEDENREEVQELSEWGQDEDADAVEDSERVILRHPEHSLKSEDEYKFADQVVHPYRSRKQTEIGSEKAISEDDLRLAATLVHDAMEGRIVDIKTEPRYVRSYNLFKGRLLTGLLYACILLNLSLVLFEKPAVENMELHYGFTMLLEILCLAYYVIRTCHHAHWRRTTLFWRDIKNIFLVLSIALTVLDMLVYVILENVHSGQHVRYSRVLRPILIMNFSDGRQIRRAWRNIRRTVKEIIHVVLLFYFFIFVFALVALKIFENSGLKFPDGSDYFTDYIESFWQLYILVTTSNNPDVMMPAYDRNRAYCFFFSVYVVLCLYLMMNVLLAVTYHSYKENMKEEIKSSARAKRRKLQQAFDVIKINSNGRDMVTYRTWKRLIGLALPKMNKNQIDLLMLILDTNKSGHIGRKEFMNVSDLLNVPVSEVEDRMTFLESFLPSMYNSKPSRILRDIVYSLPFKIVFDGVVLVDVVMIAIPVTGTDIPFCSIFILEILLKVYTYGPVKYCMNFINWFDVVITSLSLLSIILSFTMSRPDIQAVLKAIAVFRIFRILRLFVHIERFRIILDTIVNISLSIVMYCGIVFIIFYIFAIIGMEFFQGKINYYGYGENETQLYCGNPNLKDSDFYNSRYCNNNFNDVINSLLVLSTLLIENNWHIIAEGYTLVTSKVARVYFAVFHLSMSIVVMNIVTAFVVDMFMYEYTIQKDGRMDSAVEAKIKDLGLGIDANTGMEISSPMQNGDVSNIDPEASEGPRPEWRFAVRFSDFVMKSVTRHSAAAPTLNRFDGIRFHLKKRGWTKIEVLLQQLFESEIESDNEASNTAIDQGMAAHLQLN